MSEWRDLEGLSALVTGAISGIGRAAAEEGRQSETETGQHEQAARMGVIRLLKWMS